MSATATATTTVRTVRAKRPLLRLTRPGEGAFMWLHKGKQGSLQTAAQMARLVREDVVRDEGLQIFAANILMRQGLDSHADKRVVAGALCEYVQKLPYIFDPSGSFDSVSSARQTLAKGFGDCDDLSVLLATLLALVGFEPRFVLARYKAKSAGGSNGYDHVYVDVILSDGRMPLDACARTRQPGWESMRYHERLFFPIFAFPTTSLGDAMNLAVTGISTGVSFVPVVGPILSMFVGPIAGLFSRKQQRAEESQRDEFKDQVLRAMENIEAGVKACKITPEQGRAAGRELITQFYKACDTFTKKSVAQSCRAFETMDVPGGSQEGAFVSHMDRIAKAGTSCQLGASVEAASLAISPSSGSSILTGSVGGFPMWLLLVGGVAVFFMMKN